MSRIVRNKGGSTGMYTLVHEDTSILLFLYKTTIIHFFYSATITLRLPFRENSMKSSCS